MGTISVVGGGIAGLTLAAALDPARWDVTIYEQAPDRPPAGTALAMWPEVMVALGAIGAADAVRRHSLVIDRFEVADGARRPIIVNTSQQAHLVTRPRLLDALTAAVPSSAVRRTARIEDPADLATDLVVGADGVHSVVRRTVFGGDARRVGVVAFRGISPVPTSGMVELWQDGALCGLSPTVTGESNWYLACRADGDFADVESMDDAAAHRAAMSLADRFGDEAVALIGATPQSQVLRQEIWVAPARWRLTSGRTVLVGDAAHAMCPNLGRGACESILDAVTLGHALNSLDITAALRHYQRRRALRTQGVRAASRAVLALSELRRGAGVRNALLRLGPGRNAGAQERTSPSHTRP